MFTDVLTRPTPASRTSFRKVNSRSHIFRTLDKSSTLSLMLPEQVSEVEVSFFPIVTCYFGLAKIEELQQDQSLTFVPTTGKTQCQLD